MQVWISKPRGSAMGGHEDELKKRWTLAADWARGDGYKVDLNFIEPMKHEVHGDMLTRLWGAEILDHEDDIHLISELDFVPYRQGISRSRKYLSDGQLRILGVPYVTRIYAAEESTCTSPGKLTQHEDGKYPLLAPWFLLFDKQRGNLLPQDWLAPAGPFNDAANLGLRRAIESGFIDPNEFQLLKSRDLWPLAHGTRYPKIGYHLFFARELDSPHDKVICWPDCRDPLTAGQHLSDVEMLLGLKSG